MAALAADGFRGTRTTRTTRTTCRQHVSSRHCLPSLPLGCRLKGLAGSALQAAVQAALQDVDLAGAADQVAGRYSGGMRRRLSAAIAMCGSPAVVFLGELRARRQCCYCCYW